MEYDPCHIARLLLLHLCDEINDADKESLAQWAADSTQHAALLSEIQDEEAFARRIALQHPSVFGPVSERMFLRIQLSIKEAEAHSSHISEDQSSQAKALPTLWLQKLKTSWIRYAAAVLLCGSVIYYWIVQQNRPDSPSSVVSAFSRHDVMPGMDKAVLTLSDGRQILLTDTASLISEEGTIIHNIEGRLEYGRSEKMVFNTMSTPRGGQYKLILPDGTKVWLNAASSITYPTSFLGPKRVVSISGEAYFEVIKMADQPFVVKANSEEIAVLGTSFNVNAYEDEEYTKISLLEGSVKVGAMVLKPGEACLDGRIIKTDVRQDVAWKNGLFNFHHIRLPEAMRQLSRWYDVEVRYEGDFSDVEFGGQIGRNLTLGQVLTGLEGIDDVHFKLEGKTIVVTL